MSTRQKLPYAVTEQFLMAKTGSAADCEDAVVINSNYAAVIDGATSKTDRRWKTKTGGRVVADILKKAISSLPAGCGAVEAVARLTGAITDFYKKNRSLEITEKDPSRRITASVALYSCTEREVWLIGDCQVIIGGEVHCLQKIFDQITASARSALLEIALAEGASIEDLRLNDPGREFILPLLRRQAILQNNLQAGELWFPVLDGFEVPPEGIRIYQIPAQGGEIVLATDGYPCLQPNLAASESVLQSLIDKDPLMFRSYKTTKGVTPGNNSFDDRAYLRLKIEPRG
jgi:hypothetical protein